MYVCITYVTTVYYITDTNNIAVMHQPNNHEVKVHKDEKNSVQYSSPVNGDTPYSCNTVIIDLYF